MATPSDAALRYLQDPKFFIETFLHIVNEDLALVPFLFNPIQEAYYKARSPRDLVLKSRKPGISSLISAIWCHACLTSENTRAVVISHEKEATMRLFERVKRFLSTMGVGEFQLIMETEQDTQAEVRFKDTHSSFWIGTAGSRAFGRGDDITHLHLSEVSQYKNQSIITGVMEALVRGEGKSWAVMETTANGVGDFFWRKWQEASDRQVDSPWKKHFFAWWQDPRNTKALPTDSTFIPTERERKMIQLYHLSKEQVYWYCHKEKEMADRSKMPQEYPSNEREAFLSSGNHAMNLERLEVMAKRVTPPVWQGELEDDGKTVSFVPNKEGRLRVWKMPRQTAQYLISADVAEGVQNGAWSVAQVLDRSTWEQVSVWRARLEPGRFGKVLCDLGYFFNNATLVPENNNHGWASIERIRSEEYPFLLQSSELWPNEPAKPGFPTNARTRELIISALRNAVEDLVSIVNDPITIGELNTLVRDDSGKVVPQPGCWSDCAISLGIGLYCLKFLTVEERYPAAARPRGMLHHMVSNVAKPPKRRTGY